MIIGEILSHYRVTGKLGAGGMGEVYRAADTRLGRDVALKVLPESYAGDTYRMGRFEREAQVLASLNHPNIATLFGLEEQDGKRALVMELVEGQTLAERIRQGVMGIEETLLVARQIAGALEYAHERGIIHRDLKPANIKLTTEGQVKLLDFGLARALADDSFSSDASNSPTLSAMATMAGMILGTASYMSPEQAKGKPADRRADIWSFGAVLYELLARKQLYTGETASEILAGVIKEEPDWSALPPDTPLTIRKLLRRCLTKDANRRLQAIGEARIAIEEYLADPNASSAIVSEAGTTSRSPAWRRALPWAMAGLFVLTTAIALWWSWKAPKRSELPMRLSIELGPQTSLDLGRGSRGPRGSSVALSPDGTALIFVAKGADGTSRLYLRRLAETEAAPLSGTEGANSPFFSPDGQWIAFFGTGRLRKVPLQGGSPVVLCRVEGARGGSWGNDGTIVFAPTPNGALFRISDAGGEPEPLTKLDSGKGELTQRWPQVLPGGEGVLFTANNSVATFSGARTVLYSMKDGRRKDILPGAIYARYVPSGHLIYLQAEKLFAVPFDVKRQEITGAPAPVVEDVDYSPTSLGAQFSFSETGSFVYVPGKGVAGGGETIQWINARGQFQPLRSVASHYGFPRFSPDGTRLALTVDEPAIDIWVYDYARDTMTRLTFEPGINDSPVWTPDGQRLAFASDRHGGATNIYWQRADGTGPVQRLTESKNRQFPWSWTPDGRALLFVEVAEGQATGINNADIWMLPMDGDEQTGWRPGTPKVLLASPFIEVSPSVSPDGLWLAYTSNESGRFEVYVTRFPSGGGKWQVSSSGGQRPVWSPNGKELFYENAENDDAQIMVASYTGSARQFRAEKPRLWSPAKFEFKGPTSTFALHPDGKRFAVVVESQEAEINKVTLVLNFFDEIRRRVPKSKN